MEKNRRILVLGGGGREYAIAHKLSQSKDTEVYCMPGNKGTEIFAQNLVGDLSTFEWIGEHCILSEIDYVFVGPEGPLCLGIVDHFAKDYQLKHIKVFGPNADASKLEGSKIFAKKFMKEQGIPTAEFGTFHSDDAGGCAHACNYIEEHFDVHEKIVVKADGLAAGKGVEICDGIAEAKKAARSMMIDKKYGPAGDGIVIEKFIKGQELSLMVFTDGSNYKILPPARDYKKLLDGDKGPNTGGMGAYSKSDLLPFELEERICSEIIEPTLRGMTKIGSPYVGCLYLGLMVDEHGNVFVIEYNCRMGDPETQVILPRIQNDFMDLIDSVFDGTLSTFELEVDPNPRYGVVVASDGYPDNPAKGASVKIEKASCEAFGVEVVLAGIDKNCNVSGGRVAMVVGINPKDCYTSLQCADPVISFDGMFYRRDIGSAA